MTKFNIEFKNISHIDSKTVSVKSEAAMWNVLRTVRNVLSEQDLTDGAQAIVTTEDGKEFKNITFRRNSKGKIEMPNSVKETCRYTKVKAAKVAAAAKVEAKKAAKREADRRYREKKKAAKAVSARHHDLLVEGSIAAAEDPDTGINC